MDRSSTNAPTGTVAIPGYDLLDLIGEGGMGVVWRAMQHEPRRMVAIKFLNPLPTNELSIEAFERESRLMASLHHPHVVTIHSCGEIQGRHYLVMEYVSGPTLRSLLNPGTPWPIDPAAKVLDCIADALCYIHEQGILHLDLKPENVLCLPDGGVKITDFGLALRRVDAWTLSELGVAQGTIDYCPPEQRYGLPIDPRSDLFSLATIAFELFTGTLPGRVFVSACGRNPKLPAPVDAVLKKGLARDRDDRQRSVEEIRRQLAQALGKPESCETRA